MTKLDAERQKKVNGGAGYWDTYAAECVACDTCFSGRSKDLTKAKAEMHYIVNGGSKGGHRYRWL